MDEKFIGNQLKSLQAFVQLLRCSVAPDSAVIAWICASTSET
jgi:hypothetical protein